MVVYHVLGTIIEKQGKDKTILKRLTIIVEVLF